MRRRWRILITGAVVLALLSGAAAYFGYFSPRWRALAAYESAKAALARAGVGSGPERPYTPPPGTTGDAVGRAIAATPAPPLRLGDLQYVDEREGFTGYRDPTPPGPGSGPAPDRTREVLASFVPALSILAAAADSPPAGPPRIPDATGRGALALWPLIRLGEAQSAAILRPDAAPPGVGVRELARAGRTLLVSLRESAGSFLDIVLESRMEEAAVEAFARRYETDAEAPRISPDTFAGARPASDLLVRVLRRLARGDLEFAELLLGPELGLDTRVEMANRTAFTSRHFELPGVRYGTAQNAARQAERLLGFSIRFRALPPDATPDFSAIDSPPPASRPPLGLKALDDFTPMAMPDYRLGSLLRSLRALTAKREALRIGLVVTARDPTGTAPLPAFAGFDLSIESTTDARYLRVAPAKPVPLPPDVETGQKRFAGYRFRLK